jgi:hypothetical protein
MPHGFHEALIHAFEVILDPRCGCFGHPHAVFTCGKFEISNLLSNCGKYTAEIARIFANGDTSMTPSCPSIDLSREGITLQP